MKNTYLAEKEFCITAAVNQKQDSNKADSPGAKDGAEPIKFLTRLGVDCILNNLSQDHITGAELLLYVKTYVSVHTAVVFNEIGEKLHIAGVETAGDNKLAGMLNPQELLKKINRLWVKNQQSNAA